jgi:hypothetical protein
VSLLQPFQIPSYSINFYVLAALGDVQPRKTGSDNYVRFTSLGTLILTESTESISAIPYLRGCKLEKEEYFPLREEDSVFPELLHYSNLKDIEIDTIMQEYNTLKRLV